MQGSSSLSSFSRPVLLLVSLYAILYEFHIALSSASSLSLSFSISTLLPLLFHLLSCCSDCPTVLEILCCCFTVRWLSRERERERQFSFPSARVPSSCPVEQMDPLANSAHVRIHCWHCRLEGHGDSFSNIIIWTVIIALTLRCLSAQFPMVTVTQTMIIHQPSKNV